MAIAQLKAKQLAPLPTTTGAKLSAAKNTGSYSSRVGNLAQAPLFGGGSRAYGTSFGIGAQRSPNINASSGKAVLDFNQSRASFIPKNLFASVDTHHHTHRSSGSDMEKLMGYATLLSTVGKLGLEAYKEINSAKADKGGNLFNFNYNTNGFKLSGDLKNTSTLTGMKTIEDRADKQIESFNNGDYGKSSDNVKAGIEQALSGLPEGDQITIDTSSLDLSEIKLDSDDLSSFDIAAHIIDTDIAGVEFFSVQVDKGISSLSEKSQGYAQTIQSAQSEINTLEGQIQMLENKSTMTLEDKATLTDLKTKLKEAEAKKTEAEQNKAKVDTAKKELEGVKNQQIPQLISQLEAKQTQLGDIKKVKSEIQDKKYDAAKKLANDAPKTQAKMDKLADKAKNSPKAADRQKAINEYNDLVGKMTQFTTDLATVADFPEIKNSKGQTINLGDVKIDQKYTQPFEQEMLDDLKEKTKDFTAPFKPDEE